MKRKAIKFFTVFISIFMMLTMPLCVSAMQVFVNVTDDNIITLEVEPGDTIDAVKAKIQDTVGILTENQRLIFDGKQLDSNRTLADYNIKKKSKIQLLVQNNGGDINITINGTYKEGAKPADAISVDLVWDSMDFTYTAGSKGTWNASTHKYENGTEGKWLWNGATETKNSPAITVTNHSNTAVKANFAFTTAVEGFNGNFTKNALVLDTAENTEITNAPKAETSFSISGSAIDADKSLGTITVTVANAVTAVSNKAELITAITAKESAIKLTNNISLSDILDISEYNGEINLNGYTISRLSNTTVHVNNSTMIFKNGTLENNFTQALAVGQNAKVTLENCTIKTGSDFALIVYGGIAVLNDCTISSEGTYKTMSIQASGGKYGSLTLSGTTTIASGDRDWVIENEEEGCSAICLPGTYNFDPTKYVDTNNYSITENTEAGTWTVTAK